MGGVAVDGVATVGVATDMVGMAMADLVAWDSASIPVTMVSARAWAGLATAGGSVDTACLVATSDGDALRTSRAAITSRTVTTTDTGIQAMGTVDMAMDMVMGMGTAESIRTPAFRQA